MFSRYGIVTSITNKRKQNSSKTNLDVNSNREHDHKRPQMTSKTQLNSKESFPIFELFCLLLLHLHFFPFHLNS